MRRYVAEQWLTVSITTRKHSVNSFLDITYFPSSLLLPAAPSTHTPAHALAGHDLPAQPLFRRLEEATGRARARAAAAAAVRARMRS